MVKKGINGGRIILFDTVCFNSTLLCWLDEFAMSIHELAVPVLSPKAEWPESLWKSSSSWAIERIPAYIGGIPARSSAKIYSTRRPLSSRVIFYSF